MNSLHGISKQLGNSPDPIELMEKFGADGVRMGLLLTAPAGNDIPFDESLCEQGRNFNNKIWNAFRLVKGWEVADIEQPETAKHAIRWFDSVLTKTVSEMDDLFTAFLFAKLVNGSTLIVLFDISNTASPAVNSILSLIVSRFSSG